METTLGKKFAELRKLNGFTQDEMAEKLGVSPQAVSKWENDLSCPDIQSLPKLAEVLQVSAEELLQGEVLSAAAAGKSVSWLEKINSIVDLVLKAIVVAMGIALIVCSILKTLEPASGFQLTGLGLACAGILFLRQEK